MEAYTGFAACYDEFMDNVPYEEWAAFGRELLEELGCREGILLDLACGTGSLTERMAAYGYDCIGVDSSEEMLNLAMEKKEKSGSSILYLLQDMRELELYGTVAGAVCFCDSLNYLTEKEELTEVFRLVNNYLDPGAPFLFDFNTDYKYREILGESTIAENREDASFIWENYYDEESRINEYDLTLFLRGEDGRFDRQQETHFQRAYSLEEIKECLSLAGMEFVVAYDGYTREAPTHESERILVAAREGRQPGKHYV